MIANKCVRLTLESYTTMEKIRLMLLQKHYCVNKAEVLALALSTYKRLLEGKTDES